MNKNAQPINNNDDKVEISSEARELQKNQNTSNVQKSDPRKEDKLQEIREKINNDYYSSHNVISKIADNLLKRFKI
ncbi:flagellar biosynthesis anti-sigma factor FlgM [candidate division KSB1 bacterium]